MKEIDRNEIFQEIANAIEREVKLKVYWEVRWGTFWYEDNNQDMIREVLLSIENKVKENESERNN